MTKSMEMNEKVIEIYNYIKTAQEERGYPPSIREICSEFDIKSTSSGSYYLRKLEEMGMIRINYGKSRAIELTGPKAPKAEDMLQVPLIGTITAGAPIFAVESYTDTYALPSNLFRLSGDLFMLDVQGTSMIDAGINDGDKIIIRKQSYAQNGQIIAALLDGENATVKRFFKDENGVRLHPENKHMSDIYPTDMSILGVVVGLIRTNIK